MSESNVEKITNAVTEESAESKLTGNDITNPDEFSDEELEKVTGGTRSYGSVSPIPTPIA